MKAIVYDGPTQMRYADVPDPVLSGADGAIVRAAICGICGSDLHIYHGHGLNTTPGYVVGHESVGEVVEVGSAVHNFRPGDRVIISASTGCGNCHYCRRGYSMQCTDGETGGYGRGGSHGRHGASWGKGMVLPGLQAQYVAVPGADANMVALPEQISYEAAIVMTDSAPTAWLAARHVRIVPGNTVAVIGLGPIGQMAVMAAEAMGAGHIVAADTHEYRRKSAERFGAETATKDTVEALLDERTAGLGADVVIDTVGSESALTQAMQLAATGGRVAAVGVNKEGRFDFPYRMAMHKGLEFFVGLTSVQRELQEILPLAAAGRIHPEWIVTHRTGLSKGAEAYSLIEGREDGVLKIAIDPWS
jgi:threonine dehydrogenase-like Zn-dependent dehydrogenase